LTTALGGQVIYAYSTQVAVFVPQLLFEWVHEFLNGGRLIAGNYVNDPASSRLISGPTVQARTFSTWVLVCRQYFKEESLPLSTTKPLWPWQIQPRMR
jgi:hypothetical protein